MKKHFSILFLILIFGTGTAQTGIGTTTPVNKFQVETILADPAVSGAAANGNFRLSGTTGSHVLDFGLSNTATYSWIQSRLKSNYATNYNLILNPNGGNIGIGSTAPGATLEIGTSTGSIPGNLILNPTSSGTGVEGAEINLKPAPFTTSPAAQTWVIDQVSNSNNPRLRFFPLITGESKGFTILDNGNLGIGTATPSVQLQVAGDIIANSIAGSSDARFKTNITPIENALQKVVHLRGVNFNWNQKAFPEKNFSDKTEVGFIAQEVEKVLPEVVFKDNTTEEYRSVKYDKVVALLVEAIKEQQKQINSLKTEVKKLKRNKK